MRPFGLTWPLPWPLLVSNAHHYRTRALFCWVHVASHGLSFGLSWPRLGLPEASPEQPRSVPGAAQAVWMPIGEPHTSLKTRCKSNAPGGGGPFGLPWRARAHCEGANYPGSDTLKARRTAVRAHEQQFLVARTSNRPGSAPDRAPPRTRLRPGPGSSLVVRASNRLGSAPDRAPPRTGKQHWDGLGCWATGGQD